jgi:hypothetical protein
MKLERVTVNGQEVDIITEYDLKDLKGMLMQIRMLQPREFILIVENDEPIPSKN